MRGEVREESEDDLGVDQREFRPNLIDLRLILLFIEQKGEDGDVLLDREEEKGRPRLVDGGVDGRLAAPHGGNVEKDVE